MQFLKYSCSIILIISALIACNKTKEYEIENYKPLLVIEGYLHNNKPITLKVKRNIPPNEKASNYPITDATVTIWEDSLELGTMHHDSNGIYSINYLPQTSHYYKIKVQHPNFPTAEGVTYIKEPIHLNVINTHTESYLKKVKLQLPQENAIRFFGFQAVDKELSFYYCDLKSGDKFFYLYQNMTYFAGTEFAVVGFSDREIAESNLQIINDPENEGAILFSNSQTLASSYLTIETLYNVNLIIVYDLSYDVYQLFRSIAAYQKRTESSLSSPLYTPSAIHNNIKNGLGIFGYIFTYEFPIDSIKTECPLLK
ncbi:MAG: DUF4249 family protein [Bacteroidales bacterium]